MFDNLTQTVLAYKQSMTELPLVLDNLKSGTAENRLELDRFKNKLEYCQSQTVKNRASRIINSIEGNISELDKKIIEIENKFNQAQNIGSQTQELFNEIENTGDISSSWGYLPIIGISESLGVILKNCDLVNVQLKPQQQYIKNNSGLFDRFLENKVNENEYHGMASDITDIYERSKTSLIANNNVSVPKAVIIGSSIALTFLGFKTGFIQGIFNKLFSPIIKSLKGKVGV